MPILPVEEARFAATVPVLIIGGGACGLTAALAATEEGAGGGTEGSAGVLVLERDRKPTGSTSLSTGLIPAAGTRLQAERGIEDTPEIFTADILAKAKGQTDPELAAFVAGASGPALDWLMERHGLELKLVEEFLYPGHSRIRMHGTPSRTGAQLQGALLEAAAREGVDILTGAHVTGLFAESAGAMAGRVAGARIRRPDGSDEDIGCRTLILACNGYGGNPEMVRQYIPEMSEAPYHGHVGNQGDAVHWGLALGAAVADMGGYQGHGAVSHPQGLPVVWGVLTEGGFQVNLNGERFSNEVRGYSEQALDVVRQPEQIAWNIYDERCQQAARDFTEYQQLKELGAVKTAATVSGLAEQTGLPEGALERTLAGVAEMARGAQADPFSRDFTGKPPLLPPFCAIRVTGALFHTQGGLVIDTQARVLTGQDSVLTAKNQALPNLFAGGGAARGLSGPSRWGYLSGNGLLTAIVLGRTAGIHAARDVAG